MPRGKQYHSLCRLSKVLTYYHLTQLNPSEGEVISNPGMHLSIMGEYPSRQYNVWDYKNTNQGNSSSSRHDNDKALRKLRASFFITYSSSKQTLT